MRNLHLDNMRQHYITTTQKNTSEALSMAMQLWATSFPIKNSDIEGVHQLVQLINANAILLRNLCQTHGFRVQEFCEQGDKP